MWTRSKYVNAYFFPEILNVYDVLLQILAILNVLPTVIQFNFPNRKMWETSMKGLLSLVRRTTPSSFAYIGEKIGSSLNDKVMYRLLHIFGESEMC